MYRENRRNKKRGSEDEGSLVVSTYGNEYGKKSQGSDG